MFFYILKIILNWATFILKFSGEVCGIFFVNLLCRSAVSYWKFLWLSWVSLWVGIYVALIGIIIIVRKVLFSTIIRSGRRTDSRASIRWLESLQFPSTEINRRKTVLYGLSDSLLDLQNVWNGVLWKPWLEFQNVLNYVFWPCVIVGKEFSIRNDMWGNAVTIIQKVLGWDHHWIYEISEVCVIFNLLGKYGAWIDDAWDMFHVSSFWLMKISNHIFSEV